LNIHRASASTDGLKAPGASDRTGTQAGTPPQPRERPRTRRWVFTAFALAAVAGAAAVYFHPWSAPAPVVAVETVVPGPVTRVLAVNGRVAALNSVSVRSAVTGTLVPPLADEGDHVAEGDVLARIDTLLQEAILRQVEAALEAGNVTRQQAEATYARMEAMGPNVARNMLEDAARTLESAQNDVRRLSALVDQARIQLDKFTITAPIAGTILTREVDPGQLVDTSMPLFTLADLSELVVEADVDETYAAQVKTGMPVMLQLVGETVTRPGHVSFVAPRVDADTGGLAIRMSFDTPPLMPVGLTVTANIIVDQQSAALTAPRSAIMPDATGAALFLAKDGRAVRTPVTVIDWPAARLVVTSGLVPGDRVIVTAAGLTDGQAVSVPGT
jgi:RND family efflux transporter MFP subunit